MLHLLRIHAATFTEGPSTTKCYQPVSYSRMLERERYTVIFRNSCNTRILGTSGIRGHASRPSHITIDTPTSMKHDGNGDDER